MTSTRQRKTRPVPTFDHLSKKRPYELRDYIPLGDAPTGEYDAAVRALEHAKLLGNLAEIVGAESAVAAAKAAVEDACIEVVMRAMPAKAFEKLTRQYPPSDEVAAEQKEKYGAAMDWDPELLAPGLIAASCVQPAMTPEQVQSLVDEHGWNAAEYGHLFQLALDVNTQRQTVNWGN